MITILWLIFSFVCHLRQIPVYLNTIGVPEDLKSFISFKQGITYRVHSSTPGCAHKCTEDQKLFIQLGRGLHPRPSATPASGGHFALELVFSGLPYTCGVPRV